jgi:hypothetical protein
MAKRREKKDQLLHLKSHIAADVCPYMERIGAQGTKFLQCIFEIE